MPLHCAYPITTYPLPLTAAELENPAPRWARVEMLNLLEDFRRSLEGSDALKPAFEVAAEMLLLSFAALGGQRRRPGPAFIPALLRAPDSFIGNASTSPESIEAMPRSFAAVFGPVFEHGARCLDLIDVARAMPALRMTLFVAAARYIERDLGRHPDALLRLCRPITRDLDAGDISGALMSLRHLTDELTATASGPLLLQPDRFAMASDDDGRR